jgi:hypothetical protein
MKDVNGSTRRHPRVLLNEVFSKTSGKWKYGAKCRAFYQRMQSDAKCTVV